MTSILNENPRSLLSPVGVFCTDMLDDKASSKASWLVGKKTDFVGLKDKPFDCLLYTSDAADE